jgi:sugar phosphate isomerase/epimerase
MPPGLGNIPYNEVSKAIEGYSGIFTLEISPRYNSYYDESLDIARKIIK